MKKKKSYMNVSNILSEGLFDKLTKYIKTSKLKKNKTLLSKLNKINKDTKDLEASMNARLKQLDPKAKPFKFKTNKLSDFF